MWCQLLLQRRRGAGDGGCLQRRASDNKIQKKNVSGYTAVIMSGEVWFDPCTTYTTGIRRRMPALRACCSVEGWPLKMTHAYPLVRIRPVAPSFLSHASLPYLGAEFLRGIKRQTALFLEHREKGFALSNANFLLKFMSL